MLKRLREFYRDSAGQDVVEYSLLLAFIVVVSAALLLYNSQAIAGIWTRNTKNLSAGNERAY